jgi:hypothetical protein
VKVKDQTKKKEFSKKKILILLAENKFAFLLTDFYHGEVRAERKKSNSLKEETTNHRRW